MANENGQDAAKSAKVFAWAKSWLAHGRIPLVAACLAFLLTLPSLRVGLEADDYFHRMCFAKPQTFSEVSPSSWDLFKFFDGDEKRNRKLMDLGMLPWWTHPKAKAHFYRPLTAFTHWLDYKLWPQSEMLPHLHNALWYALSVFAVALLFQLIVPKPWMAGACSILYAFDDAHGWPAGWTANRNALICTFFGALAIWAYIRWRRGHFPIGAYLSPLLLMASLLAKEAGVAVLAFVFLYELFLAASYSVKSLLPNLCVFLGWLAYYKISGFGVSNIGLYVDPAGTPLLFLKTVLQRAPILLLGQWTGPSAEASVALGPIVGRYFLYASLIVITWLACLFYPLLRRCNYGRYFFGTMMLSLVPSCAAFPADRLLFYTGIGAFGLLVLLVEGLLEERDWLPQSATWRKFARHSVAILLLIHLIIAPFLFLFRTAYPFGPPAIAKFYITISDDVDIKDKDVIILNSPSVLHTMYFPLMRAMSGKPTPRACWTLATGVPHLDILRKDSRTITVKPAYGFLQIWFDSLVRSDRDPLQLGEEVKLDGLTVSIAKLNSRKLPAFADFTFAEDLSSTRYVWLVWDGQSYRPYELPSINQEVRLETPLIVDIPKKYIPTFFGVEQ